MIPLRYIILAYLLGPTPLAAAVCTQDQAAASGWEDIIVYSSFFGVWCGLSLGLLCLIGMQPWRYLLNESD